MLWTKRRVEPAEVRLSVVVVAHGMARELPRTLLSLSPAYQRSMSGRDYEIILVDSGSVPPISSELLRSHGLVGRIVTLTTPPFTLARAVNRGLAAATGAVIGVLFDGARLASPGLLATALCQIGTEGGRLVTPLGYDLGYDQQVHAVAAGYDMAREDRLLAAIDWTRDGERLFDIAVPDADTPPEWPGPLMAASLPFMARGDWTRIGGADEAFDARTGGYLAHDIVSGSVRLHGIDLVVLASEGTFHQVHGGLLGSGGADNAAALTARWSRKYADLRGHAPAPIPPERASSWQGPARVPMPLPVERGRTAVPGESIDRLVGLGRAKLAEGHRAAALAVGRLARRLAPDDTPPLRLLRDIGWSAYGDTDETQVLMALGEAHQLLGDKPEAAVHFRQALARDPQQVAAQVALAQLRFEGAPYLDRFDELHAVLKPAIYLEIGVAWGASTAKAKPPTLAIGVDPAPRPHTNLHTEVHFYNQTSDAFFASDALQAITGGQPVDLAFIDGLHLFEQVLRDFINVERQCRPGATIVLHDTAPLDEPTQSRALNTSFHTGDVWKTVLCLKHYRPDLAIVTLPAAPTGLTLVRNLDPTSTVLADRYDEAVKAFIDAPYAPFAAEMAKNINLTSRSIAELYGQT